MIERAAQQSIFSPEWGRQMRFITGPRQAGKTTLAKQHLKRVGAERLYYLWDQRVVRNRYRQNGLFFTTDSAPARQKQWVCFDEIHKMPQWKNILKGIFDASEDHYQFVITGSAKLNIIRRAGDGLAGRYFAFHLLPLCLAEAVHAPAQMNTIPTDARQWIQMRLDAPPVAPGDLESLLEHGGFPEPFLQQSRKFHAMWSQGYIDTVVREDIGALTRIVDREYLVDLCGLLPEMTGSPLSESSLAAHIQVSPPTIKSYLRRLEDFYLLFILRPYAKNIKRSLLRAGKAYFYDWSRIKDPGAVFENYVACEIKARCLLWTDMTGDTYDLYYMRNKQKQEIDFLMVKNRVPWLLIEAKARDQQLEQHYHEMAATLAIPFVQICRESGIAAMSAKDMYRISAARFFA
jgi:predicted AAA+ superfamily ATPase